jgi:glutamate-1-semialdehyde aminotransferase
MDDTDLAKYAGLATKLYAHEERFKRMQDLAPELAEALRRLLAARDADVTTGRLQFGSDPEAANIARALIAKIDGEQP